MPSRVGRDAGKGLPADVNSQLFEPFVTTKTDGIGIGLTIARTIVEAHRGAGRQQQPRGRRHVHRHAALPRDVGARRDGPSTTWA